MDFDEYAASECCSAVIQCMGQPGGSWRLDTCICGHSGDRGCDKAVKRDTFLIGRKGHAIDMSDVKSLFLKAEKQFEKDAEPDRSYSCGMLSCCLNDKAIEISWSS